MGNALAPIAGLRAPTPESKPKEKYSKALVVLIGEVKILIEVTESKLTCGWLISEVIRNYRGRRPIVALETGKQLEILDM